MLRWISRASFFTKVSSEMTPPITHYNAVVVGSGLAGLTAALKLSEKGLSVALVEKTASLGGNSIKASSGINGAPTEFQDPNENDSIESFVSDTTLSGKGLSDARLVDILAGDSANAISWLSQEIGVDLSMVSRLGGHSHARTHRGKGKLPPGFAIISALTKKLKEQPNVEIMTLTRLQGFSRMDQHVTGVVLDLESEENVGHKGRIIMTDNVVLATGGFCADTSGPESLIREYRPDLQNLPLTNGQQTTGDGHRLAKFGLDAKLIQMDQIQVHPTGFVQLKDALTISSKWKFLCGELIRGIGGVLLSSQSGKRFVNELSTRDTVTHAINENSGPMAIIVVSEEDYQKAASHIGFYMSQLLMFKGQAEDIIQKLTEIDPENKCSKEEILSALEDYNEGLARQSDPLGRTHFGNAFGNTYYFGFVTPVLHFTMGGVETNEQRQIVKNDGSIIPNVYAIGELSAGVHGANRLAGSSLLECVVFGTRVADHISRRL